MVCAYFEQSENFFLGVNIHLILQLPNDVRCAGKDLICLFSLVFCYRSLLFRYLSLLRSLPVEPSCEHG